MSNCHTPVVADQSETDQAARIPGQAGESFATGCATLTRDCPAQDREDRKKETEPRPRKKLTRRTDRDYSQSLRRGMQFAFLALNVWIGVEFYQWVRWAETAGQALRVERPAGIEGWLPIAGLMQLKYVILAHQWPSINPAGLFLIAAFLLMSFFFRKAFCSWLCPVGTLSEYLWKLGRSTFRRNFSLPRWFDF